jgi:hypothetical protein
MFTVFSMLRSTSQYKKHASIIAPLHLEGVDKSKQGTWEALYKAARDQTLVDELSSSPEATAAPSFSAEDQPLQIPRSFGPRSEDAKAFAGCRTRGAFDICRIGT